MEPTWLERRVVDAVHQELIRRHGGHHGARDDGLIESALARPRHRWGYEPGVHLTVLAASYGYGLAKNHGYTDGNKRIAFMAMYVFLRVNGLEIEAPEPEVVLLMTGVAAGELSEAEVAAWLREHVVAVEDG